MSVVKGIRNLLAQASGFADSSGMKAFARENPLVTFGLVAPTAAFAGSEIVAPIAQGAYNLTPIPDALEEIRQRERFERARQDRGEMVADDARRRRIQEMVERNMAVVASRDPHLYNQVMAGRVLPQGAVVLGGPRRQDLMEELAYAMGTSQTPEEFSSLFQ